MLSRESLRSNLWSMCRSSSSCRLLLSWLRSLSRWSSLCSCWVTCSRIRWSRSSLLLCSCSSASLSSLSFLSLSSWSLLRRRSSSSCSSIRFLSSSILLFSSSVLLLRSLSCSRRSSSSSSLRSLSSSSCCCLCSLSSRLSRSSCLWRSSSSSSLCRFSSCSRWSLLCSLLWSSSSSRLLRCSKSSSDSLFPRNPVLLVLKSCWSRSPVRLIMSLSLRDSNCDDLTAGCSVVVVVCRSESSLTSIRGIVNILPGWDCCWDIWCCCSWLDFWDWIWGWRRGDWLVFWL